MRVHHNSLLHLLQRVCGCVCLCVCVCVGATVTCLLPVGDLTSNTRQECCVLLSRDVSLMGVSVCVCVLEG